MYTSQTLHKPTTPTLRAFLADEAIAPLGHRRDGRPIYPIAGGAPDGGDGSSGGAGQSGGDGGQAAGQNGGQAGGDGGQGAAQQSGGTDGQQNGQQAQDGQQGQQQADAQKVEDLPDWAQKLIKDTRKEAGDRRTQLTQAEQRQQEIVRAFAKAAGIELPDDQAQQPDPTELAQQLTATQVQAREAAAELVVWRNATDLGVDPGAVTDSRSFANAIKDLDPASETFAEDVKKAAKKAAEQNPKLKAGRAPGASSVDHAGGSGTQRRTSNGPVSLDSAVSAHYGTS